MNYRQMDQIERCHNASLMKAQHSITQIAILIGRNKATISRECYRIAGDRGYCSKQATELSIEHAEQSHNACTLAPWLKEQTVAPPRLQWGSEYAASRLPLRDEAFYEHVYTDKNKGGSMFNRLYCRKQNRKSYVSRRDRPGPLTNRWHSSERPKQTAGHKQVSHRQYQTFILTNHKQAIETGVERKSGHSVLGKVSKKTQELVSQSIISALRSFKAIVKTLAKSSEGTVVVTKHWGARVTLLDLLPAGPAGLARTSTAHCANMCPRSAVWKT
jgi:IS30 family transposase